MKWPTLFATIMLCFTAETSELRLAPSSFSLEDKNYVFTDFQQASYSIVYNLQEKTATVESTIKLYAEENGHLLFDLVPQAEAAYLNGEKVQLRKVIAPGGVTTYTVPTIPGKKGSNELRISHKINKLLDFEKRGVSSAFWMTDLKNRRFLEQFLPTSFEYDSYQINLEVRVLSAKGHKLRTNGSITELGENHWSVVYPDYFSTSSLYFHLYPSRKFNERWGHYTSITGRKVPLFVYSNSGTKKFWNKAVKVLRELENDYGPWPHPRVLIYGAGRGGMEYCGATITSLGALDHELLHSYFARGVMPASGNAGWMDEAIASWRDKGYPRLTSKALVKGNMAGHSIYRRQTDRDSYSKGRKFMGYLDYILRNQGGLKIFLREFFQEFKFQRVTTPLFRSKLETYSGKALEPLFNRFLRAGTSEVKRKTCESDEKMGNEELHKLL